MLLWSQKFLCGTGVYFETTPAVKRKTKCLARYKYYRRGFIYCKDLFKDFCTSVVGYSYVDCTVYDP